jgi:hypothetical protein
LKNNHRFDLKGNIIIITIIIIIKLINLKKNIIIIEQKKQVLFEGIKNYKNLGQISLILLLIS